MRISRLALILLGVPLALMTADACALCVGLCACTVSTTDVVFGVLNPLSFSNTDSTGSIKVSCGGIAGLLIPLKVDISKGGGANYAQRAMSFGVRTMSYNLYFDASRLQVFGDGSAGTVNATGSISLNLLGIGPSVTFPVYGRIPGGQTTVAPGNYTDTLAVTLTYF